MDTIHIDRLRHRHARAHILSRTHILQHEKFRVREILIKRLLKNLLSSFHGQCLKPAYQADKAP